MDSIALTKKEFNDPTRIVYAASGINLHEGKAGSKSKMKKNTKPLYKINKGEPHGTSG
jgi:hypothetical protein